MPQWLGAPREESLPELIARKKYSRAITLLTERLEKRPPTARSRLQLADLLVLAGRGSEAVPVFMDLAEEFARDGFVAKAVAILKRVDRIAPSADLDRRLEALVQQQRATGETPTTVAMSALPEFGIEEIRDDEPSAVPAADSPVPPEPPAERALSVEPELELDDQATEAEWLRERDSGRADAPGSDASPPAESDGAAGVSSRIRNAFRRFVASLPGSASADGAVEAGGGTAEPLPDEIVIDSAELAYGGAAPPEAEGEEGDTVSEEVFEGQLLDLVQGAITHPQKAPRDAQSADPGDPARKLVATELFGDLTEDELLAVLKGLTLRTFAPGDVILTEGELRGQSLFVISSGTVKIFVRDPAARNVQLGGLGEGDFFGEISGLSAQPRTATVTAAAASELLELDKQTLDSVARAHPHVRVRLEERFIERASSPAAAAVRAVPLPADEARRRAGEVLAAHFGAARWDPRVRLRLARLLVESGKPDDAVPVLIGLADELGRAGYTEKAIAVIKKVEQIQSRHIQELNLAPLRREAGIEPAGQSAAPAGAEDARDAFQGWLVEVVRERVGHAPTPPEAVESAQRAGFRSGLRSSPLFDGFSEDELLALIRSFRLRSVEPGDIVVTEGERGQGLFIVAAGRVRVFVRDPGGHDTELCELSDGAFFGEMSTLSGRPRSATVTAATSCDLLELDREALDELTGERPRVRRVLDEFMAARSQNPDAARIRGAEPPAEGGS